MLPVYNRSSLVTQTIQSALALDEGPMELIVVDDASTDGTRDALAQLNDPRISIAAIETNVGANGARNLGIALARAPFVAFLDSDDTYLRGRLAKPLKVFEKHGDVGIILTGFTTQKGRKTTVVSVPDRIYDGHEFRQLIARYVLPPGTSGLTVRRDLLLAVGGFDPDLKRIQDRDLVMRVAPLTKGASVEGALWHKRWQKDGISSGRRAYYPALMEFIARHPIYQTEELAIRDYLLARHLVALATAMKWRQLRSDYRYACSVLTPRPRGLRSLLRNYFLMRHARRRMEAVLAGKLNMTEDEVTGQLHGMRNASGL